MIDKIGGKDRVRERLNPFDDLIEFLPQGGAIIVKHRQRHRLLHLRPAQFGFLCGFLCGRRCYHERPFHMTLRDIHAQMPITRTDALDWLAVMGMAMYDTGVSEPMKSQIAGTFRRAALMLVNSR